MSKPKMAPCGIDCGQCGQYLVSVEHDMEAAESLVEWFRSMGWIGENEAGEAVMKMAPLCKGCWDKSEVFWPMCGPNGRCGFRVCCEEKGLNHCGECGGYPCEQFDGWAEINGAHEDAMRRLDLLKSGGCVSGGQ